MYNWPTEVVFNDLFQFKLDLRKKWESDDRDSFFRASNLSKLVSYTDFYRKQTEVSIVELLLTANELGQDEFYFSMAQNLLERGAPVPRSHKNQEDFKSLKEYLNHLANSYYDLFLALYNDPEIINRQGEDGKTILHHAAEIGYCNGSNSAATIHLRLFSSKLADFSIKDKKGNTPVHLAALHCNDKVTRNYIFPNYVREAAKRDFDFTTPNTAGSTVTHLAVEYGTLRKLLEIVPEIDVNVQNPYGTTPLILAIRWMHLDAAILLLNAGADPTLFKEANTEPMQLIEDYTNDLVRLVELTKANETGELNQFCQKHRDFLIEFYQKQKNSNKEPNNLEKYAKEQAIIIEDQLADIASTLEQLESIRSRIENYIQAKTQMADNNLSFWQHYTNNNNKEESSPLPLQAQPGQ